MDFNSFSKEHMFDKVVTPSDVGKLNRLVIPKQHALKYFPLESGTSNYHIINHEDDVDDCKLQRGLLLNFEEEEEEEEEDHYRTGGGSCGGKIWRFRYSHWRSSQSYVITKGWSRFVKEKKLNSGDLISFYRAKDRLFIDWRYQIHHPHQYFYFNQPQQQQQQRKQRCYWRAPAGHGPQLFSPNLYYFNQPSRLKYSFLGRRPPLIVGGYGVVGGGGANYEPAGADQGILNNEAQQHQHQQRPHEIVTRKDSTENEEEEKEKEKEEGEAEKEEAATTIIHGTLLDSEAAAAAVAANYKAGEMKQLRLFGVNMKCAR